VTLVKFPSEKAQILGTTLESAVGSDTWRQGIVNPCFTTRDSARNARFSLVSDKDIKFIYEYCRTGGMTSIYSGDNATSKRLTLRNH
jgi:hypothetical protein